MSRHLLARAWEADAPDDDGQSRPAVVPFAENGEEGHWITLDDGRHIYIEGESAQKAREGGRDAVGSRRAGGAQKRRPVRQGEPPLGDPLLPGRAGFRSRACNLAGRIGPEEGAAVVLSLVNALAH